MITELNTYIILNVLIYECLKALNSLILHTCICQSASEGGSVVISREGFDYLLTQSWPEPRMFLFCSFPVDRTGVSHHSVLSSSSKKKKETPVY